MSDLMHYDALVEKHNAAYAAFREIYSAKNPPPVMPDVERTDWLITGALAVMVVASVIVSGSRTIDEFGGGLVGISAFAMLEVGIVAYAYIRTKKHYDASRHQSVKKLTNAGMALAFVVTLAANLHATTKHNGVATAQWLDTAILVLIAISAPSLALISGDLLGMEAVSAAQRQRKTTAQYTDAMQAWLEGLNRSWDSQKSRWGIKIEAVPMDSNGISNGNPVEIERPVLPSASTLGHSKQPMARKIVQDYLAEHPEALEISPVKLAEMLNVGKSTVYNVLNEMKKGGQ